MSNKANWTVGRMGPRQKAKARARLPQVCAHCGAEHNLTLDHKVARAHGGTNDISNLQMLCIGCNFEKGQMEQLVSEALRPCFDRRQALGKPTSFLTANNVEALEALDATGGGEGTVGEEDEKV